MTIILVTESRRKGWNCYQFWAMLGYIVWSCLSFYIF